MPSRLIMSNVPYTLQDIQLASLVPNILNPHQDALHPPALVAGSDFSWRNQQDVHIWLANTEESLLATQLTRLISLSYSQGMNKTLRLSSCEGRIYELKQPKSLFRRLCSQDNVKTWLQDGIEDGADSYFIIGFRTFFNAKLSQLSQDESQIFGHAHTPAPIGGKALSDMADVGLTGERNKESIGHEGFVVPGERVYAICYRKIRFRWFKVHDAKNAILERTNQWIMCSRNRAELDTDSDIVEADLGDEDIGKDEHLGNIVAGHASEEYVLLHEERS